MKYKYLQLNPYKIVHKSSCKLLLPGDPKKELLFDQVQQKGILKLEIFLDNQ